MARPLITLLVGVVLAVLAALAIGGALASRGFVLVLLTVLAGAIVMAVVGRRAALRRRAEELRVLSDGASSSHLPARDTSTDHQETDRG